jgi:hypothetical protein
MGMMGDYEIAQWQQAAGIKLPSARAAELLEQMSDNAFELIKLIELGRCGIRDGDSRWHGTDVMGGAMNDIIALAEGYREATDVKELA